MADGTVHRWDVTGLLEDEDRPPVNLELTVENPDGSVIEEMTD